ncbi:MAG: rpfC [Rickettsiaceae bacterium]|jgi:signal transduction histidine kinase|nr:rpfC [Rickettsiaceae bacterium]
MSLSKKLALYFLIISFFIFSYLLYTFIKDSSLERKRVFSDLVVEASFVSKIFDDSAKYTSMVLGEMINDISRNPQDKNYVSKVLKSFSILHDNRIKDILSISMFSWVDKTDMLVVNSEVGVLNKKLDVSDRDYLKFTKEQPDKLFFGKPTLGAVSRQYIIPVGMGLVDTKNQYQGSIVTGLNIENIHQKFLKGRILPGSNLQIVYGNEINVIKNSLDLDGKYLAKINLEDPGIQVLRQSSIFVSSPTTIYQRIPGTPYGVVVNINNINQLEIRKNHLVEFLAIFLVFAVLIYFLRRDFIKPILRLSQEARSVSLGNTDINLPKSNIAEINQLSSSILSIKQFILSERSLKEKLEIAKRRLDLSNQKLQNLLKTASHDLRNYIGGVAGLSQVMIGDSDKLIEKLGAEDKENLENIQKHNKEQVFIDALKDNNEYLKMIINQSDQLMKFVKDLLEIDRDNFETLNVNNGYCNVAEVIEELVVLGAAFASDQEVVVKSDVQKKLPELNCDRRKLRQVLDNLITNAVKYSPKNSEVNISAKLLDLGEKLCIAIEDRGIGMTEEEIKMALNGDGKNIDKSGLDKEIDSHGIGMMIVKEAVEAIGAVMEIESAKGKGTTVKLWFNVGW